MNSNLACIILAAGHSTRMKSKTSKVLHPIAGRPLIGWLLETVKSLNPEKTIIVTSPDGDAVRDYVAPLQSVIQQRAQGTADAVKAAMPALAGFKGTILVLFADGPLYRAETLQNLLAAYDKPKSGLAFLAMRPDDPFGYGRIITKDDGTLSAIVEEKDANDAQKKINLCWTGIMCGDAESFAYGLPRIDNKNVKGEYYLTDLPGVVSGATILVEAPFAETLGANNRAELAVLERKIQDRLRARALENGATLIDPSSTYFSYDTQLGRDVTIEPNVFFGPGVTIADDVTIKAFSHIEGAKIESGAHIGPFARLRPGTIIGPDCKLGNFVETKNATLAAGVKASHLAYIGDADVGANVNFSCGAITVNYDGVNKNKTIIGRDAMIGSNVNLVAPITIGDGAYVAAGSTITKDVPADALAVAREKPSVIEGWAAKKRKSQKKKD